MKMKKDVLVQFDGKELRSGTQIISVGFCRSHDHILRLIEKYSETFEGISTLKVETLRTKGRTGKEYFLTREQVAFLSTLFRNTKETVAFKARIITTFSAMEDDLKKLRNQRYDPKWQSERQIGKIDRFQLTDALKPLLPYAIEQNPDTNYSNKPDTLYVNYTNMIYKALFIFNIPAVKVRGWLNQEQLRNLSHLEFIIGTLIMKSMAAKLYYKEIYKTAKIKAIAYGDLIDKTEVIKANNQLALFG